ncbi:tyrosine-type recombinase/integrase [Nocardia tengchongensis]
MADAVKIYLDTITVENTRRGYAAALNRLVRDFGADIDVALLGREPDRVSGWLVFVWGSKSPKTFNLRLTALASACAWWRKQDWLAGPLVRLQSRPAPPDNSRAMTRDEVGELLAADVPLRERTLWTMLHETAARAEEILTLDVADLDTVNRCASVVRKGGARDVVYWQTGTARLLPRLIAGRKRGPLFLTDRRAKPSVALADIDPTTHRARLSYRRAATLFEQHTASMKRGPFTLHRRVHADADGVVRTCLGAQSREVHQGVGRGAGTVAGRHRPGVASSQPMIVTALRRLRCRVCVVPIPG